ncbi:hypothetical protein [Streptomyces niveus]|uniref:hypothetical protein n=1 Tax=Streptomyces niveus TaxID=193462 RepID=UPI00341A0999
MTENWPAAPLWMFACDTCARLYGRLRWASADQVWEMIDSDLLALRLAQHIARDHYRRVPSARHPGCWLCDHYDRDEPESELGQAMTVLGREHRARILFLPTLAALAG